MSEKKKYLLIIALTLTFLTVVTVNYIFETNKTKRLRTQWDTKNQSELATKAIEAYALQDNSELKDSRNSRLKKYFSENSPVFSAKTENIAGGVVKSSAKVKSLEPCEEQEGGDLCLLVKTDTKLETKSSDSNKHQTYWITIIKISDGDFKAYDAGPWYE